MGLLNIFRRRKKPEYSLPSISYHIAYFLIPPLADETWEMLAHTFAASPPTAGALFYDLGCRAQGVDPRSEDAERFGAHSGELESGHEYLVLEYPTPPPLNLDPNNLGCLMAGGLPVLAPFYSALLRQKDSNKGEYYILGQSPMDGRTTLRSISPRPDYTNHNLGPGPEPNLEAFLAVLPVDLGGVVASISEG